MRYPCIVSKEQNMSERPKPYIGVSGIACPEHQKLAIELFEASGLRKNNKRDLLLGVKALHKCQWLDQPWKRDDQWDVVGEAAFRGALQQDAGSLNVAQAYFDKNLVGDSQYRDAYLERIYTRGEDWIDGIQYDMLPWHENPDTLTFLHQTKMRHPGTKVLLQCWQGTLERYNPTQLARVLGQHAEALDYILFDTSHGKGVPFDTAGLLPYLEQAYTNENLATVGIALAGGLGGQETMDQLGAIAAQFPDISWDAESRLHPRRPDGGMPLDLDTVKRYFDYSATALSL